MNENAGIKSEKDREPMYIRILAKIEKAGNRLPDPVVLFAFLCVLLLIISYFTAWSIPVRGRRLPRLTC